MPLGSKVPVCEDRTLDIEPVGVHVSWTASADGRLVHEIIATKASLNSWINDSLIAQSYLILTWPLSQAEVGY
jgi:hypothetical protein